jgi:DNA-binding response OmpR family regulator
MSQTIVVIEDNPDSARLAQKLLTRGDYDVKLAEDGESGFDLVLESEPALVLVDLGLPDVDGQTIVAMLRQQPAIEQTPIIAFTAWPQDTAHEMATAYGCDGVITKPIDTRSFLDQIKAFLDASQVKPDDTKES